MIHLLRRSDCDASMEQRLKNGNVFFTREYGDFVGNEGESLYIVVDEERCVPVRFRKKAIFRWAVLESEPLCFTEFPKKPLDTFLDEVMECLQKQLKVHWVHSTAAGLFPDTPQHCQRIPFGSHVIDLRQNEETLWACVHSKHRNVIRRAEREGIEIRCGGVELLDDYLQMDEETWKRSGQSGAGKHYYAQRLKALGEHAKLYVAFLNGIPQAGALYYANPAMCYYMYGASSDHSSLGAANLLQWTAVLQMKEQGVEKFSFVGCRINEDETSKYHGIQRFKERFGGKLEQGYLFRFMANPWMFHLYCRAVQLRLHLKGPYQDAIAQELHKWKDVQK